MTYIVLLNWNGYEDTIECLESIFENTNNKKIVIIDNNSSDDSINHISGYLEKLNLSYLCKNEDELLFPEDVRVLLIKNKDNYGFAGGYNIAINFLINKIDCNYMWMLNTDSVINNSTLIELEKIVLSDKKVGFVGSIINYYDNKNIVQSAGCRLYKYLGVTKLLYKNENYDEVIKNNLNNFDYLMGASLLVSMEMIKDIGIMDSSYFLYSEEVDWQYIAKNNGWKLLLAKKSIIYHKVSQSTIDKKHMYYFYINRSSIKFTKKYFNFLTLLIVTLNLFLITVIRNLKFPKNIIYGLKGIIKGYKQ